MEITAKAIAGKAIEKVGEIEMSRRSFLKVGFLTALAASNGLETVCDVLNEVTKPSKLDRAMDAIGLDFVDKACIKWYLFDLKLKRIIWLVGKVESAGKWIKSKFSSNDK